MLNNVNLKLMVRKILVFVLLVVRIVLNVKILINAYPHVNRDGSLKKTNVFKTVLMDIFHLFMMRKELDHAILYKISIVIVVNAMRIVKTVLDQKQYLALNVLNAWIIKNFYGKEIA